MRVFLTFYIHSLALLESNLMEVTWSREKKSSDQYIHLTFLMASLPGLVTTAPLSHQTETKKTRPPKYHAGPVRARPGTEIPAQNQNDCRPTVLVAGRQQEKRRLKEKASNRKEKREKGKPTRAVPFYLPRQLAIAVATTPRMAQKNRAKHLQPQNLPGARAPPVSKADNPQSHDAAMTRRRARIGMGACEFFVIRPCLDSTHLKF